MLPLDEDEHILEIIQQRKYLPYRMKDTFLVLVVILAAVLMFSDFVIPSLTFFILTFTYLLFRLIVRRVRILKLQYTITNKRLLCTNKKDNSIHYSYYFNDFPKMTLFENSFNAGYIIFGEPQPDFKVEWTGIGYRSGVNMTENQFMLENISSVRKVYNDLRVRSGRSEKKYN